MGVAVMENTPKVFDQPLTGDDFLTGSAYGFRYSITRWDYGGRGWRWEVEGWGREANGHGEPTLEAAAAKVEGAIRAMARDMAGLLRLAG